VNARHPLGNSAVGDFDKRAPDLVSAVLRHGSLPRGDANFVLKTSERTARNTLSDLVDRGFLKSDTPKSPVRIGLPSRFQGTAVSEPVYRCRSQYRGTAITVVRVSGLLGRSAPENCLASVVFPACRGPIPKTARVSSSAASTSGRIFRSMIARRCRPNHASIFNVFTVHFKVHRRPIFIHLGNGAAVWRYVSRLVRDHLISTSMPPRPLQSSSLSKSQARSARS
jgi:hypothetical protein